MSPHRDVAGPEQADAFAQAGADQLLVHLRRRIGVDDLDTAIAELADAYRLD